MFRARYAARSGRFASNPAKANFSARGPLCWAHASLYMTPVGPWRSLVSASVWGAEGREFESLRPDHSENAHLLSGVGVSLFRRRYA